MFLIKLLLCRLSPLWYGLCLYLSRELSQVASAGSLLSRSLQHQRDLLEVESAHLTAHSIRQESHLHNLTTALAGYFHNLGHLLTKLEFWGREYTFSLPLRSQRELSSILDEIRSVTSFAQQGFTCPTPFPVFAVKKTLHNLIAVFDPQLRTQGVHHVFHCPSGIMLYKSEVVFSQVLLNLYQNAVEALLARPLSQRCLKTTVRVAGDRLLIDITDSGLGLNTRELRRLQILSETERVGVSGIGYSYIMNALRKHLNANLYICTELGKGTQIRLNIPLLEG